MTYRLLFIVIVVVLNFQTVFSQVIFEAEDATFSSGKVDDKHVGFTGDGFVDTENKDGEFIQWSFNSLKAVHDSIGFRYALGKDEIRSMQVFINNNLIDTINFDNTIEFTTYTYKYTIASINKGSNTIKLLAINEFGAPNIDHLTIKNDTTAHFNVNIELQGEGTIEKSSLLDSIPYGTRMKLSATAAAGYTFENWSGNIASTKNPLAFTVDNDYSLNAHFTNSLPAFPGAEGFGANTTGGRGGNVIEVTNLNNAGVGSLRAAIERPGARTIVFKVSGTIELESTLSIKTDNITIVGQTAPGDGITLSNYTLKIDADNVIIRYIRSRLGDKKGVQDDAINCRKHKNIIVDHCSFSWSVDEVASFYDNENLTIQYCIFSEALFNSIHEKGKHSYGGIIGGKSVSFHHNLYASNTSRNPRFCGSRYSGLPELELVDFRNNVLFNWGFNSIYGAEGGSYNIVNNYYKDGPATSTSVRTRIIAPDPSNGENNQPSGIWGQFYVNGNHITASETVTKNNWAGVYTSKNKNEILTQTEFEVKQIKPQSATFAFEKVLAEVGASLPNRDAVDTRIINEVATGICTFGNGIIDSPDEVGGWPELASTTPLTDTDKDGMPDEWENKMGLNPNNPDDRNDDITGNGYTNIEDYLNSLVAETVFLIRPTNFSIESINNLEVKLKWDDEIENETGYRLERRKQKEPYQVVKKLNANQTNVTDNLPMSGIYTYRLAAINNETQSLYTDSLVVDVATSIQSVNSKRFILYPNPVKNTLHLVFEFMDEKGAEIKITNLLGDIVFYKKQVQSKNSSINIESLPKGVYTVHLIYGANINVQKIIKAY